VWFRKGIWYRFRQGIAGILSVAFYASLFAGASALPAQPVSVPSLSSPAFQSQDLDPYLNQARRSPNQSNWEAALSYGISILKANWEAQMDADIAGYIASVTNTDFFHSESEYQDYLLKELELQKQEALATWELDVEQTLTTERRAFLQTLANANVAESNVIAKNSSISALGTVQELTLTAALFTSEEAYEKSSDAFSAIELDWQTKYRKNFRDGLLQYQTGLNALEMDLNAFNQELDLAEGMFLQNMAAMDGYEATVRSGIQSYLSTMQTYLGSSGIFYQENCTGTQCTTDFNTMNQAGIDLSDFIASMNQSLAQGDPLSAITQNLVTYFEAQKLQAEANRTNWWNQIRGNGSLDLGVSLPAFMGSEVRGVGYFGNYQRMGDAMGLLPEYYGLTGGAVSGSPLLQGIRTWADSGNATGLMEYVNANLDGRVIEGINGGTTFCGNDRGTNFNQGRFGGWCYNQTHIDGVGLSWDGTQASYWENPLRVPNPEWAFLYVTGNPETHLCCGGGPATINAQTSYTAYLRYSWYDTNAEVNYNTWDGYLAQLNPALDHWRDNLLPALVSWEAQVSQYKTDYTDWKTQADADRLTALNAYQAQRDQLLQDRNDWLANTRRSYRQGEQKMQALKEEHLALKDSFSGANEDALRQRAREVSVGLEAEIRTLQPSVSGSVLDSFRAQLPPLEQKFLTAYKNAPGTEVMERFSTDLTKSLNGVINLALVSGMQEKAEERNELSLQRLAQQIEQHQINEYGAAHKVEIKDGGLVSTRQIYKGTAKRMGGNGTNASHYQPEYGVRTFTFEVPLATVRLEANADLFSAGNAGNALAQYDANLKVYDDAFSRAESSINAQLLGEDQYAEQKYKMYINDRDLQVAAALDYERRHKDPFGGLLNSFVSAMMGGLSLGQALTQVTTNLVTGAMAEATGLPVGLFAGIAGGLQGGQSMGDSARSALKSVEKDLMTQAVAEASGLPAGLVGGLLSGQSPEKALKSYTEQLIYAELEEATGIPGLGAYIQRQNAEKAAKQAQTKQVAQTALAVCTMACQYAGPYGAAAAMASQVALTAWQAHDGYEEGGIKGALVAGGSSILNSYIAGTGALPGVGVSLSYNEETGFGGSVSVDALSAAGIDAKGFKAGASLSFAEGQGVTGGGLNAGYAAGGSSLGLNLNYDQKGSFTGGSVNASVSGSAGDHRSLALSGGLSFDASGNYAGSNIGLNHSGGGMLENKHGRGLDMGTGLSLNFNADGTGSMGITSRLGVGDRYGSDAINSGGLSTGSTFAFDQTGTTRSSTSSLAFYGTTQTKEEALNRLKQDKEIYGLTDEQVKDLEGRIEMGSEGYIEHKRALIAAEILRDAGGSLTEADVARMSSEEKQALGDLLDTLAQDALAKGNIASAEGTDPKFKGDPSSSSSVLGDIWNKVGGFFSDSLVVGRDGFIDKDGIYNERICFTRGTLIRCASTDERRDS